MDKTIYHGRLTTNLTIEGLEISNSQSKCLTIKSTDICSNTSVSSEIYCLVFSEGTSQYFQKTYASYEGKNIRLHFETNSIDSVLIKKSKGSEKYFQLTKTLPPSYLDVNPSQFIQSQYQISSQSENCLNSTNEAFIAPPIIKLASKSLQDNKITFDITAPVNNLVGSPTLSVYFYNSDSSLSVVLPFENEISLPNTIGEYQNIVMSYEYSSGELIFSNRIVSKINYFIFVPTAFTPNNDGLNDILEIFGLPTGNGSIQIFNRWGEVVYESDEVKNGWNGRIRSAPAPQGTYRYKVNFEIPDGNFRTQVGTFVLIR